MGFDGFQFGCNIRAQFLKILNSGADSGLDFLDKVKTKYNTVSWPGGLAGLAH